MSKKSAVEWLKWIVEKFVAPIVTSVVVLIIGKYWMDHKIDRLRSDTTTIVASAKSEVIAYVDKRTTKSSQSVVGTKNQSVVNSGDNNIAVQNISETKPDFKKDSEQSNILATRISEGVGLLRFDPCQITTDEQYKKYQESVNSWFNNTRMDLAKISNKSLAAFDGTSTSLGIETSMSYNCHKPTILLQKTIERYVASLREIMRGL